MIKLKYLQWLFAVNLAFCQAGACSASPQWESLARQGYRFVRQDRAGDAADCYRRAFGLAEKEAVPAEKLANILLNQAESLMSAGKLEQSRQVILQAQELVKRAKCDNPTLELRLLRRQERQAMLDNHAVERAAFQAKIADLTCRIWGRKHFRSIEALTYLQACQLCAQQFKESVDTGRAVLSIMSEFGMGETHDLWNWTRLHLGQGLIGLGKLAEARPYLESVAQGRGHFNFAGEAAAELAGIAGAEHNLVQREKWSKEALRLWLNPNIEEPKYQGLWIGLAYCSLLRDRTIPMTVEQQLRRILLNIEQRLPKEKDITWHLQKSQCVHCLVYCLIRRGNVKEAEVLAHWQMPAGKIPNIDNLWASLATSELIANEYQRRGDFKGAIRQWDRQIAALEKQRQLDQAQSYIGAYKAKRDEERKKAGIQ